MTHEQVANLFKFSRELILSKFNNLDMLPVVGYFVDGEVTSHDSKTVPYGAVLPNTARFEDIEGEEYLVVDTCLWSGKYPEVSDVSTFNQSLELINIRGKFNKENLYYEVSDYELDCICMLNQNTNPAFKKARMDVDANFSDEFEQFKAEFTEMLQNIKENGSEQVEGKKTEFTLIDLERIWGSIYNQLEEKYPDTDGWGSIYRIEGVYEETTDNSKFTLLRKRETDELFKVDLNIDENGILTLGDEATVVIELIVETDEVVKFEEPENIEKYKEFIQENVTPEPEPEPTPEPEPEVNYEEKYNELQTKFNEIMVKYSELENEIVPLREFKADIEEKENQEKLELELKEKNDLIELFSTKLPKDSIENIIDDVNNFTLDEIKTKLSLALSDVILAKNDEGEDNLDDVNFNMDNMNKKISREERLIEEVKKTKKKLKK